MASALQNILLPGESEFYVKTLEPSSIEDLGSMRWFELHERLQKLHQQSILEAASPREEIVKEAFVSFSKVAVLVQEAICVSVWREKVFPFLLDVEPLPKNTFMPYMVLYHEATAIALLETILFHQECCEALEDTCIDLIDYCAYYVVCLSSLSDIFKVETQDEIKRTSCEELKYQQKELAFDIGMRSISILSYLSQSLDRLPPYATTRMFETHDVPMLFKNIIENSPWVRQNHKGQTLKYIDGKWRTSRGEDRMVVTRSEGQIWLCLRQLLLDPQCPVHYEINDHRKNQLIKLQGKLHDVLLDQLPPLIDLKQWLNHVAIANISNDQKRPIVVELVPQIRQSLLNRSKQQWKHLIKKQTETFFNNGQEEMIKVATRLKSTFDLDTIDALTSEPRSCSGCGEPASKRCSRCKTHWFCGRECQVKNWPKHKPACDMLFEALESTASET